MNLLRHPIRRYFSQIEVQKDLINSGLTSESANAVIKAIDNCGVTKFDMQKMESGIRSDMQKMESGIRSDMQKMETGIRNDMQKMESGIRSDMQKMETGLRGGDMQKIEITVNNLKNEISNIGKDIKIWIGGSAISLIGIGIGLKKIDFV